MGRCFRGRRRRASSCLATNRPATAISSLERSEVQIIVNALKCAPEAALAQLDTCWLAGRRRAKQLAGRPTD